MRLFDCIAEYGYVIVDECHHLSAHNPERVSGAPCFYGTRVPIKTLFDSLAAGQTLEEFIDDFEGVSREQAEDAPSTFVEEGGNVLQLKEPRSP